MTGIIVLFLYCPTITDDKGAGGWDAQWSEAARPIHSRWSQLYVKKQGHGRQVSTDWP